MMHFRFRKVALGLLALSLLAACGKQEQAYQPQFSSRAVASDVQEISFGVHPLHNPQRLAELYGPIVEYLNHNIKGVHIHLEASRDYAGFDQRMKDRHFEFALPNPYQTVRAIDHGYHVFAKMGDDSNFRAILLLRRDSNIRELSELKGKKISYPAKTSLAPTLLMQYYLHQHGFNANNDMQNLYVGSQESSMVNAYLGNVAAGATWPIPWLAFQKDHPEMAQKLEMRWQTEPFINCGLVARNDVPPELVSRIGELLTHLHETKAGRALLARLPLSRFEPADDANYDLVRAFIAKYTKELHPIEE
jgi:phosphonate transport system substrate-binding protein